MVILKSFQITYDLLLSPSLISLHSLPSACANHHHLTAKPKWHGQQPTCNHTETQTTTRNIKWVSKGRHFGPRHNRHSHTWQLAATAPSTLQCILLSEGHGVRREGFGGRGRPMPCQLKNQKEQYNLHWFVYITHCYIYQNTSIHLCSSQALWAAMRFTWAGLTTGSGGRGLVGAAGLFWT